MLGRLARIIRSQMTSFIAAAEDPEKVLDRAVAEMQRDLIQLRQSVAQAIATQKRTERQCHQTQTLIQEWYNRAQLALQKGEEDRARDALMQRQTYLRMQTQLSDYVAEQKNVIARLKANMRDLEVQIADARTRRDMYIARARSAAASQRIQDWVSQVGNGRSPGVLNQMENKVLDLEAQAEAITALNQSAAEQSLAAQFAALESTDAQRVESDLAELKTHLRDRT